jgi:epsilon-lactone hydrolase
MQWFWSIRLTSLPPRTGAYLREASPRWTGAAMRVLRLAFALALGATAGFSSNVFSQQTAPSLSQNDSSYVDAHGTAYVYRIVPIPQTVSPQAQNYLITPVPHPPEGASVAENRASTDAMQARDSALNLAKYPANVAKSTIARVPVLIVTPVEPIPADKADRVLICLHGGGFTTDSGSRTESIPIAHLTRTKVVSVLYRLAPEHPFPAAVDDSVAVYKEMLKTYEPRHIGIYGASAGGILTAEVAARIKQLGLPMPGALGIFTGSGDFSMSGDSTSIYSVTGLAAHTTPKTGSGPWLSAYVGSTDPKDPILSPLYSDLHGMPPTLFLTSTRDMMLSGTATLHRAFLRAGDDAQLVVFEALTHGFWYEASLPESQEADELIAHFFDVHLDSANSPVGYCPGR